MPIWPSQFLLLACGLPREPVTRGTAALQPRLGRGACTGQSCCSVSRDSVRNSKARPRGACWSHDARRSARLSVKPCLLMAVGCDGRCWTLPSREVRRGGCRPSHPHGPKHMTGQLPWTLVKHTGMQPSSRITCGALGSCKDDRRGEAIGASRCSHAGSWDETCSQAPSRCRRHACE